MGHGQVEKTIEKEGGLVIISAPGVTETYTRAQLAQDGILLRIAKAFARLGNSQRPVTAEDVSRVTQTIEKTDIE